MFNKFEDYVKQPDYKHKLEIYSDGNNDYTYVLPEYYNKDCLCYGQKIKSKDGEKLFPAIKRKVYGNPNLSEIDTNTNECFNSILRDKLRKLVRKSKCHAKAKYELNRAFISSSAQADVLLGYDLELAVLEHAYDVFPALSLVL